MPDQSMPLAFLSLPLLAAVAPACRGAEQWLPPLRLACARFGVATPLRVAAFLAEAAHESGDLNRLSESLNYDVPNLLKTYPKRIAPWRAAQIGRKPGRPADQQAIAEAVYGGRLGNHVTGDAWRYRGAGLLQVTGFANHDAVAQAFDLATDAVPDWLRTREGAALSAAWWFNRHGCNDLADAGAIDEISIVINGGKNGLEDRRARYFAARHVLGL